MKRIVEWRYSSTHC